MYFLSFGGQSSKIKVPSIGVGSGERAPRGLEVVAFCPRPHTASYLWGPKAQGSLSSCRDSNQSDQGPTFTPL